jgi:23S rRNA pseudouridine2605 synthase
VQERLQKILARAGFASRRGAEQLILAGRVTVNGEIVREMGTKADLAVDDVRVDDVRVKAPRSGPVYLVLNKPKGVVTTRSDPEGRPTVMSLVPAVAGLFPVGRLDVTTEGLILLTNDGAFAERVSHPRYEVPRVYHAKVSGVPDDHALERLRRGVRLDDDFVAADRVRVIEADNNAWVEVTLHEGKHHEVRRMLEAVGHPVSKLRRVAFGPVTTKGLEPGEFRALTPEEVEGLRKGLAARVTPTRIAVRRGPKPKPAPSRHERSRPPFGKEVSKRPFDRGEREADRGSRPSGEGFERRGPRRSEDDRGNDRRFDRGAGRSERRGGDRPFDRRGGFTKRGGAFEKRSGTFGKRGTGSFEDGGADGGADRRFERGEGGSERRGGARPFDKRGGFAKRGGAFEKRSGTFAKRGTGYSQDRGGSFGRRGASSGGGRACEERGGFDGRGGTDRQDGFEKRGGSQKRGTFDKRGTSGQRGIAGSRRGSRPSGPRRGGRG